MPERAHGSTQVYGTAKEIMEVISDFEAYPEWAGQLKEVRVLERDRRGRGTVVSFEVETPVFPAAYTLEPLDDQSTRVTYELLVGLNLPLPGLVKRQAARQIVKSALSDLKRRV